MRPSAQPFLWKWVLFAWEWKIISISKVEHLNSFWYRGPGELENGLFRVTTIIFKYPDHVNSYIYASICYFIFLYLLQFFFYPVTFANNLFCLFRPCKQLTINIWGGAQSIKGFATLKNVVNLQFASEVRPEVVQDIFKKVKITQVTCLHGKKFADRNVYNDKSDYWRLLQQEWFERGRLRKWYGRLRCV